MTPLPPSELNRKYLNQLRGQQPVSIDQFTPEDFKRVAEVDTAFCLDFSEIAFRKGYFPMGTVDAANTLPSFIMISGGITCAAASLVLLFRRKRTRTAVGRGA